jgi:hypothetical protein
LPDGIDQVVSFGVAAGSPVGTFDQPLALATAPTA